MKETVEKVGRYIVCNGLDSDSRKRQLIYKRFYLFKYLRLNTDLSLEKIGKLFDKDHSTVVYGLSQYDNFKEDKEFFRLTIDLHEEFPLDFKKKYTIELGTAKLPYKIYESIKRRSKKKGHLSLKETVIDILIHG